MSPQPAQPSPRSPRSGELALIEQIRRRAGQGTGFGDRLRLGIGDDCAIVRPKAGEEIVVTTDFSLEGRHFRRDWHSPESIGHRTLARGLSDIAAMGARPVAAFLSLALPRAVSGDRAWVDGFLRGLLGLAERSAVPLAGGDTSESPSEAVLADIVVLGAVKQGGSLRRSGARPGDRLFVTGTLGGAATELMTVARGELKSVTSSGPGSAEHPHLFPEPRLRTGALLAGRGLASAAMDLSDGLSTDLAHLCAASGVGAEITADALPFHALLHGTDRKQALRAALHGGEDYELLFTARPRKPVPGKIGGVAVTEIGHITPAPVGRRTAVVLIGDDGRSHPLKPGGWEHLR